MQIAHAEPNDQSTLELSFAEVNLPVGIGAIGMRRAFLASGRFARPLIISYNVPSPPTAAITLSIVSLVVAPSSSRPFVTHS